MRSSTVHPVLRFLRRLQSDEPVGELSDGALLARFVGRRDEDAFAALVRRHGPLVLGVCHRILRDAHDADDAFQATFLVLARRAGSIGRPELLGNWLYGVACRTARGARARAARRRAELRPLPEPAVADTTEAVAWRDLRPVLDEELGRLPDKYRAAVVLCDLEGRTHEEAARRLGCPRATVTTRLARARARLRVRLARRGVALSGVVLAALLSREAASAALPAGLAEGAIRAALHFAAGRAAVGTVSASAAALAEGVLTTMFWGQVTKVAAVVLAVGLLGGGGVLAYRALAGEPNRPARKEAAAKDSPPKPSDPAADRRKLQGTWVAESGEKDGQPLADAALRQIWLDINGDEIAFHPSGKDHTRVTFTLDPARTPKTMTMTAQDGPDRGKGIPAIYAVQGDRLKLCFDTNKGEKRPKTFAAPQGSGFLALVLKRVPELSQDQKQLWGAWQAVSGEENGKPLPDNFIKNEKAVFHGDRVQLSSIDDQGEGTFTLDPKKTPKWIDFTVNDKQKGREARAFGIYEVKGDTLKLCMAEDKDGNQRPTEFVGQGKQIMLVLKRVPEEPETPAGK